MGISKDKEAYEEWEAWGKHGASVQAEERRWPRWMLPRREAEKWSRERREQGSSGCARMCTRTLSQPNFSEMTTIHCRSLTDLLAECPPTASSAGLSVFHSGLEPICSLLPDSRHSAARTHSAPSFRLLSSSLQQAEDFSLALTPARPSAHLLAGQIGPSDLHLKANFSVYYSDFVFYLC